MADRYTGQQAAVYQGLLLGLHQLTIHRIPFLLWDTGGSTMRIFVYFTSDCTGPALTFDRSEDAVHHSPDGWDVMFAPDTGNTDAPWEDVSTGLTGPELVALIRARIPAAILQAGWEKQNRQQDERWAAIAAQGLEPLRARLDHENTQRRARGEAELAWTIDDNDPQVICIWIHLPDGSVLGLSRSSADLTTPDGWLALRYATPGTYLNDVHGESQAMLGDEITGDRVLQLIDAHLQPEQTRARITSVSETNLLLGRDAGLRTVTTEQRCAFDSIVEIYDVPRWLTKVDITRYPRTQADDFILFACTFPLR